MYEISFNFTSLNLKELYPLIFNCMKINLKALIVVPLLIVVSNFATAEKKQGEISIDPPYWWAGMKNSSVQLLVHYPQIRDTEPSVSYPGVSIDSVVRLESPNYQIIYLNVNKSVAPGKMDIFFKSEEKSLAAKYELKKRDGVMPTPFSSADVLYLIMPDRFADGDTTNNDVDGLKFHAPVNRNVPSGRHGGDLKGIEQHLKYIDSLGVTAIWLNPVLENDMPGGSYHGYAISD